MNRIPDSNDRSQLSFLKDWLDIHLRDACDVLQKPLLVTEFGKSCKDPGFSNDERDAMFRTVYSKVYLSARTGGATAGSLFWQLLAQGMDSYRDGYEVILGESPSTTRVITLQSHKLRTIAKLKRAKAMKGKH